MAEDLGEKTEDATPRKLSRAREDGRIPRSTDLASALLLTCATVILWVLAAPTLDLVAPVAALPAAPPALPLPPLTLPSASR